MLDAEQYRSAALTRSRDELAVPFERTVFDAPRLWLDADQVVAAIDEVKPRAGRADAVRERRRSAVELHLDGGDDSDLTSRIPAAGWPAARPDGRRVLAAHADPRRPSCAADCSPNYR